jgi:conjugal transfer pilus assembly protein TraW
MAYLLKLLLLLLTAPLDHGVHGNTFPIDEEDLIDYIQSRIRSMDAAKIQNSFQNPKPVSGLVEAKTHAMHYFDPSVVAKVDIKDAEQKIIVQKGSAYNPLEHFSLPQNLLFFDGDQKEHIRWAKTHESEAKWILVKGNPFDLEKKEKRPVFFDQNGLLVQKLSIKAVPARVTQEGMRLKIESIPIEEASCDS